MLFAFFQVALLKKRVKVISDGTVPCEDDTLQAGDATNALTQSPLKEQEEVPEVNEGKQFLTVYL